jgi:hypothetical protein
LLHLLGVCRVASLAWELVLRAFHPTYNALGILIFLLLDVFLNKLGIKPLKAVGLHLEAVIEVREVLDVVVDCLGPLLLLSERHLQDVAIHAIYWVVRIPYLLLHYQWNRFKWPVQGNVYWVLKLME